MCLSGLVGACSSGDGVESDSEPAYAFERNAAGEIVVDERNFTIAETDRYFADHSAEHAVNTFRHSREMSTVENQFVVRENRDVMYSHAVVDISEGATLVNPEWDVFSVIQVIDENQYTIASIYPGEQQTFTPDDVALGNHLFLNMRTGVRSLDEAGFAEAHAHQDSVQINANAATPYAPKGFEQSSLDETRARLTARMAEADQPQYYFGTKDEVEPTQFLIASAVGIFGLPIKDAAYLNTIQPTGAARTGAPSRITLPRPPLAFDRGGFFSVTTYDEKGWIVTENYALNNNTAEANEDGSITFHFNASGMPNNIDVVENWTMLVRLYAPSSVDAIMNYMKEAEANIVVETLDGLAGGAESVTEENYIRAEVDFSFADFQRNAGGEVNEFFYITRPTPLDEQTVVRINRDTLYAGAVVDTEGGAMVTIPEFPDDRYFSVFVIDNDHYAPAVFYAPGTHALPDDTKYVGLIQRIQLMDPDDPADVALVNELQKQITVEASSADPFPTPRWNRDEMLALRAGYEVEFQKFDQYEPDWMGPNGEVNEATRHLGVAGAWGLLPEKDAVYINYTGPANPDVCYRATYAVPANDAFWSITVYGSDGFMKTDNNIVNDRNVSLNEDGTFTVYFGAEERCGNQANRVDITEGWNFLMRVYRPGPSILRREYVLPEVEAFTDP
ncbi:MAG: DUF1254 domain-containing protein [Pseudomonadota bacterium]